MARVSFFDMHPDGAIPEWLATPKGYRLKRHYDSYGRPVNRNPLPAIAAMKVLTAASHAKTARDILRNPRRRNESRDDAELRRAAALFEAFTGRKPERVQRIDLGPQPKTGLAFGQLIEVRYQSFRDGRYYRHSFWPKNSRPLLIATHDGKQVLLVGGLYTFTERGIENK